MLNCILFQDSKDALNVYASLKKSVPPSTLSFEVGYRMESLHDVIAKAIYTLGDDLIANNDIFIVIICGFTAKECLKKVPRWFIDNKDVLISAMDHVAIVLNPLMKAPHKKLLKTLCENAKLAVSYPEDQAVISIAEMTEKLKELSAT